MKIFLTIFLSVVFFQQVLAQSTEPAATRNGFVPLDSMSFSDIEAAIIRNDSIFFDAYNNSKLQVYADYYSEDLEFYHDKGGLSTSKKEMVDATVRNVFGKVTRELLPGSIEVSPISRFGAVAIGSHRFFNRVENSRSAYSKFVTVWKYQDGRWLITRVISLHK